MNQKYEISNLISNIASITEIIGIAIIAIFFKKVIFDESFIDFADSKPKKAGYDKKESRGRIISTSVSKYTPPHLFTTSKRT